MSPNTARAEVPSVDTPILAWLPSFVAPLRPKAVPSQVPDVAISTAPGCARLLLQQPICVVDVVESMVGLVHQVATRSGIEPKRDDTSCHGGTCKADGLEMSRTPVESVSRVAWVLEDFWPSWDA